MKLTKEEKVQLEGILYYARATLITDLRDAEKLTLAYGTARNAIKDRADTALSRIGFINTMLDKLNEGE